MRTLLRRVARLSFSTKLAAASAVITLLTAGVIMLTSIRAVEHARVDAFTERAIYIALGLAHDIGGALEHGNLPLARVKAVKALSRPHMQWVLVLDSDREPIIDTRYASEQLAVPEETLKTLLDSQGYRTVLLRAGSHPVMLAAAPLPAAKQGSKVVVALSTEQLDATIGRAKALALVGSLASSALAGLLVASAARLLSRPLSSLAATARAISEGDLTRRVREPLSVDMATVIRSFNEMADRLAEAQAEVNRYAATLETLVEERTRELEAKARALELSNAKMEQARLATLSILEDVTEANERLRELDRLKSEFLANVSHELRTPLNAIIGFSELLCDGVGGEVSEMQQEFISGILVSARHLLQLISDLLDLTKIQAGKVVLEPELFELDGLAAEVLNIIRPSADKKRQRLEVAVQPGLRVYADRFRVRQVLLNLLSNAVKFSSEGGWIRLEAERRDGRVHISVSDNGIGIPADKQDVIFEAFSQADTSPTRRHEGSGLGLAISKSLVEMHGGTLTVRSTPGEGSTFSFTLAEGLDDNAPREEAERPTWILDLGYKNGLSPGGPRETGDASILLDGKEAS